MASAPVISNVASWANFWAKDIRQDVHEIFHERFQIYVDTLFVERDNLQLSKGL